jgi:hypothetical protein
MSAALMGVGIREGRQAYGSMRESCDRDVIRWYGDGVADRSCAHTFAEVEAERRGEEIFSRDEAMTIQLWTDGEDGKCAVTTNTAM